MPSDDAQQKRLMACSRGWFAGLSMMVIASGAMAQSSVTLYGLIDQSLLLVTNVRGGRTIGLSDNGIQGNRWGLAGSENLGGGLRAVFRLESGFNASTGVLGQGGRLFGAQAYVGLAGHYGSVLAGRQINTDVSLIAVPFSSASQWSGILGSHPGDVDNFYDTFRVPNAIKYIAPTLHGFDFQALYAPGGTPGNFTRGQVASAAATYTYGAIALGGSYNNARNPNLGLAAGTANVNTPITMAGVYYPSPVDSGFASAYTYQVFSGAISYTLGGMKLGALYTNTQFQGLGDLNSGPNPNHYLGTATFQNAEFNTQYWISPSLNVGVAYDITTRNSVSTTTVPAGKGSARYQHATIGVQYLLSKTTFAYAVATTQRASGIDSTGKAAVAANNFLGASSSSNQSAVRVGLNVHF
jgi:predicted porin